MSDSAERKIKLLLLYEILRVQTDERHSLTTGDLSDALQIRRCGELPHTSHGRRTSGETEDCMQRQVRIAPRKSADERYSHATGRMQSIGCSGRVCT